jgi:transposase-like protein
MSALVKPKYRIVHAARSLGRTIWKHWTSYHRRSLVETKMRCFKLLGERVRARDLDRQVAELQMRAAILNRFTRLRTPVTVAML